MARKVNRPTTSIATLWPVAVAILVVAGAVALLVLHVQTASAPPSAAPSVFEGEHYPSQGHEGHMPGDERRYAHFKYSSDPPTSGYHREVMTSVLVSSVPLPKYVQVHLLEHGNVLLQYNCLLPCPDVVGALTQIADGYDAKLIPPDVAQPTAAEVQGAEESGEAVIVAPYPGMPHRIALTAWTRLATLDDVDRTKITSFIDRWLHDTDNLSQ
jgi:Protein of unknown function (DUF3105)